MTQQHYLILALLLILMGVIANATGSWAERMNPEGITPHAPAALESETSPKPVTTEVQARDAYAFGASMGLLGAGLLYCLLAAGLLLKARSAAKPVNRFIYWVFGLAVAGFTLSYWVDDYFY